MEKRIINAKSKLQIGLPAKTLNPTIINALKHTCNLNNKVIDSCYLFMKGVEKQENPLLTLGVLFSQFDKDSVNTTMQSIVDTLQKHLTPEQELDLMILNNQTHIIELLQKLEGVTIFARQPIY